MSSLVNPTPCTDSSLAAAEPIIASGTTDTWAWLLLEYAGRWEPKAWPHADIPAAVKAHIDAALAATPGSRLLLIRRGDSCDGGDLRCFVANTQPGAERLHRLTVPNYEALCSVDLVGALAGRLPEGSEPIEQLYAVCTHGKRDSCCALHGQALYRAVQGVRPESTWQSTHQGGHRFAPTMLVFPSGYHLGRVPSTGSRSLVGAHERRELGGLKTLRGRTALSAVQQAAEHLVRARDGLLAYDALTVGTPEPVEEGRWRVPIIRARDGEASTITVVSERRSDGPLIFKSCAKTDTTVATHWRLASQGAGRAS